MTRIVHPFPIAPNRCCISDSTRVDYSIDFVSVATACADRTGAAASAGSPPERSCWSDSRAAAPVL